MKSNRRNFIKQIGYVSIGFSLMGATGLEDDPLSDLLQDKKTDGRPDQDQVNAWLRVLENGQVWILSGKVELGQGIRIALKQIAAEELDTDLEMIEVSLAETGKTPDEGYTAGSRSIESSGMAIRNAAAFAREVVLKMASEKWGIPVGQLQLKNGTVSGADRKAFLHEVIDGKQIEQKVGTPSEIKGKTVRKWVGKPVHRTDIEDMVRGNPVFVQDLRFPGMVHARVIRPSGYTAQLDSFDESAIENMPGFLKLVRKGSFLGVIAEEE
ncbi:MAG: molybdopterin cofactor-binding domain-containing protein, partial [Pricia sp.]